MSAGLTPNEISLVAISLAVTGCPYVHGKQVRGVVDGIRPDIPRTGLDRRRPAYNAAFEVCRCWKNWMNRKPQIASVFAKGSHPTMSHAIIRRLCTAQSAGDGFAMLTPRMRAGIRACSSQAMKAARHKESPRPSGEPSPTETSRR
jgi:hypothetical protein